MNTRVRGLALRAVYRLVEGNRWLRALFGGAVVWGCCCHFFAVACQVGGDHETAVGMFAIGLIFWAKAALIFVYSALRRH